MDRMLPLGTRVRSRGDSTVTGTVQGHGHLHDGPASHGPRPLLLVALDRYIILGDDCTTSVVGFAPGNVDVIG